jgi:tRNA(Ile)-lysidine synthase
MPSEARLAEMTAQLFDARDDADIRLEHEGLTLVRFRERICIERLQGVRAWRQAWHGELEVDLAEHGAVHFDRVEGEGLEAALSAEPGWHFAGRAGGERLRTDPRRPTRTLKKPAAGIPRSAMGARTHAVSLPRGAPRLGSRNRHRGRLRLPGRLAGIAPHLASKGLKN